jgi:hypothetical protein
MESQKKPVAASFTAVVVDSWDKCLLRVVTAELLVASRAGENNG